MNTSDYLYLAVCKISTFIEQWHLDGARSKNHGGGGQAEMWGHNLICQIMGGLRPLVPPPLSHPVPFTQSQIWITVFSILFITCQQPILNSKSINLIHDLNQKLLHIEKKEQKKMVESEIRIGCWHEMNKWSKDFIQILSNIQKMVNF